MPVRLFCNDGNVVFLAQQVAGDTELARLSAKVFRIGNVALRRLVCRLAPAVTAVCRSHKKAHAAKGRGAVVVSPSHRELRLRGHHRVTDVGIECRSLAALGFHLGPCWDVVQVDLHPYCLLRRGHLLNSVPADLRGTAAQVSICTTSGG